MSSTNTNFIVRRMEGIETKLKKEMPAFLGNQPFFVLLLTRVEVRRLPT